MCIVDASPRVLRLFVRLAPTSIALGCASQRLIAQLYRSVEHGLASGHRRNAGEAGV
jgi:hypothetical protein